jgi:hypothetical protein
MTRKKKPRADYTPRTLRQRVIEVLQVFDRDLVEGIIELDSLCVEALDSDDRDAFLEASFWLRSALASYGMCPEYREKLDENRRIFGAIGDETSPLTPEDERWLHDYVSYHDASVTRGIK